MSLLKNLKEYLSDERGSYLYAILDSAIESRVKEYIEQYDLPSWILYKDERDREALREKAPYLVRLNIDDEATEILLEEGYGSNWGCFVVSDTQAEELATHLAQYTKIYSAVHEQQIYMRFYDPRAWERYINILAIEEQEEFFSELNTLLIENPKDFRELWSYRLEHKRVEKRVVSLEESG